MPSRFPHAFETSQLQRNWLPSSQLAKLAKTGKGGKGEAKADESEAERLHHCLIEKFQRTEVETISFVC